MAEIGNLFVSIKSTVDSAGFTKARTAINDIAKAGIAMGALLGAAALKAAKMAGIQEQAQNSLADAMVTAGTFTEEAYEHNLEYAASLQRMTTYGDEAILGVQRMLTNFGAEGKMLDKLTKATLDLAAAKKMDLSAAADLVAKSVGSSTNALTRYGIEVSGAVGSTERYQMAVDNISRLFGGAAKAQAETYLGKVEQINNRWNDFIETVGEQVIPVLLELIDIVESSILPMLENWSKDMGKTGKTTSWLGNTLRELIKTVIGVKAAFDLAGNAIALYWLAMTGNFKAAKLGWEELKDKTTEYGELLKKAAETEVSIRERTEDRKTAIIERASQRKNQKLKADTKVEEKESSKRIRIWQSESGDKTAAAEAYRANEREQTAIDFQDFLLKTQSRLETTQAFVQQVSDTFQSFYDLKKVQIENDTLKETESATAAYEQRKAWIMANVADEAERNRQLDELEKGHAATIENIEKQGAARKAKEGQKMKKFAIAEAIINTLVSGVKSMANFGWPVGAIMAALALASGYALVAKIKAQKFAQGGFVNKATPAVFGEAGAEVALPLNNPKTINALSRALSMAGGSGAGGNIYVTIPAITTRGEARRMGDIIGQQIFNRVRRNRKV